MIINLYKPVGWTSFDAVKKLRNITREKKVGHGGTLDPFAEGVLIIGTGGDTKRLTDISASSKSYRAVLQLGKATDTLDLTGTVTEESSLPELSPAKIEAVLNSFIGEQKQIPPMYSAKRVGGQRLYKLARKNISIKREPVDIIIHLIELIEWNQNEIEFSCHCSKGTYIRVLGSDIALKLGTVGHLTRLIRTSVGDHTVADSLTIDEFLTKWKSSAA